MNRITSMWAVLALSLICLPALADSGKHANASSAPKVSTMSGEVVDTGCYLGHAARGEKHISCATKCISEGMPMGLLTNDGTLYLLTLNHDNADPYNSLKTMAGKTVSVTGTVMARGGMKAIDVTAVRAAPSR